MSDRIVTLPEKLAREIARVTELRALYASMKDMPGIMVQPALMMMDASLEAAKIAAGSQDIEGQMRAVLDLEGFEK